ncbi:Fic family protein [Siansivirga zeaxanthinifaciens]|nr:Fic family protein [Siansivirga zeaxanthinifaciens]
MVKNHSFVDGNKRIAAACFFKIFKTKQHAF